MNLAGKSLAPFLEQNRKSDNSELHQRLRTSRMALAELPPLDAEPARQHLEHLVGEIYLLELHHIRITFADETCKDKAIFNMRLLILTDVMAERKLQ